MYNPIGSRVRDMRELRGLTQGQLAYKADTTASQISRLENDERPGAQASTLAKIAKVLDTTLDYLVGLTDDPGIPDQTSTLPVNTQAKLQLIADGLAEFDEETQNVILDLMIQTLKTGVWLTTTTTSTTTTTTTTLREPDERTGEDE